ncbi:MAG: hypothetical protein GDA48_17015 [Hormoscilla sp. GM102CHS1]|nr:hypothetical protein [Hormoscilla sp. GM102CHS1]
MQKIGINREDALKLISIVSDLRAKTGIQKYWGLRSILMIAKICKDHDIPIGLGNDEFRDVCTDVLLSRLGINPDRTKIKLSEVPNKKVASNKVRKVYKYLQL